MARIEIYRILWKIRAIWRECLFFL